MTFDQIPTLWLLLGFLGQGLFSCRFLVQWVASERRRRSVMPVMFWWFSIGGGTCLFVYALHRGDPVFMVGQGAGLLIYARNLMLLRKERLAGGTPAV